MVVINMTKNDRFTEDPHFALLENYKTKKVTSHNKIDDLVSWIAIEDNSKGYRELDFYKVSKDFELTIFH